ncbi:MAG: DUF5069 domain-containing protein [Verrucomicrobiota bacterium]
MYNYSFTKDLQALWLHAVRLYQEGSREPGTYFSPAQVSTLNGMGLGVQELYDFAEDFVKYGEPDFGTCLLVNAVRREYFLEEQGGEPSGHKIDMASLPPKDAEVRGIGWLPRLLPKARAKLRGEMPDDLMYGCGGDRRFFKTHDIHPAEFLRVVWSAGDNDDAIIDWVQNRIEAQAAPAGAI